MLDTQANKQKGRLLGLMLKMRVRVRQLANRHKLDKVIGIEISRQRSKHRQRGREQSLRIIMGQCSSETKQSLLVCQGYQ